MARLMWDNTGERYYETGVRNAVLYLYDSAAKSYNKGVAWNGISSISESPSGAEANAIYADDTKYLELISNEEFGMTVEAYTYPDEWMECDGSKEILTGMVMGQQSRRMFGMSYRTTLGNDVDGNDYGYKLHLVYGCRATPSERGYSTINDSPEAISFSWEVTTTPVNVDQAKPISIITIDSTKFGKTNMTRLEGILYGSETEEARLPLPNELISMFRDSVPDVAG